MYQNTKKRGGGGELQEKYNLLFLCKLVLSND